MDGAAVGAADGTEERGLEGQRAARQGSRPGQGVSWKKCDAVGFRGWAGGGTLGAAGVNGRLWTDGGAAEGKGGWVW